MECTGTSNSLKLHYGKFNSVYFHTHFSKFKFGLFDRQPGTLGRVINIYKCDYVSTLDILGKKDGLADIPLVPEIHCLPGRKHCILTSSPFADCLVANASQIALRVQLINSRSLIFARKCHGRLGRFF